MDNSKLDESLSDMECGRETSNYFLVRQNFEIITDNQSQINNACDKAQNDQYPQMNFQVENEFRKLLQNLSTSKGIHRKPALTSLSAKPHIIDADTVQIVNVIPTIKSSNETSLTGCKTPNESKKSESIRKQTTEVNYGLPKFTRVKTLQQKIRAREKKRRYNERKKLRKCIENLEITFGEIELKGSKR
ncbi:uncharacterized protein LOC116340182 isoform X2 [Contarinia nasturtii]|uniref:uncharacterized protein LOC116340182 isoform X2 n=1 Tax=Contarinia nasturtii TaxID=265458 RepID=UPI0012D461D7|nr:uncharacterized protein LOC116340182 isoform X2 [Contarinia nasturtii]